MRRCSRQLVAAVALGVTLSAAALASSTNDRDYQMGDDDAGASPGGLVGTTVDSEVPAFGAQQNLEKFSGSPTYVDVGPSGLARPDAGAGELGIQFDGTSDYLEGARLGLPSTSEASTGWPLSPPGPLDYSGISNRGFQLWVYPTLAGSAERQNIVMDTLQHGVGITMTGNWFMQYANTEIDTGVAVTTNQWHHIMVVRPFGPTGSNSGARMYLDGIAISAASGGYDGEDNNLLAISSNTGDNINNFPGFSNFFSGTLDELEMFVMGTSTDTQFDYGTFNLGEDNDFIAGQLTGVAGDVNQDTVFNQLDKDAFIAGWLSVNLVNGVPAGDLTTIGDGDLNFDGSTDLYDLVIMQDALAAAGMAAISGDDLTGSVPEPSTLFLVVLGLSGLPFLSRRRRD